MVRVYAHKINGQWAEIPPETFTALPTMIVTSTAAPYTGPLQITARSPSG